MELKTEVKVAPLAEKEKAEIPQSEQIQEAVPEPEPVPTKIPPTPEGYPKSEPVTEATRDSATEKNAEPPATQEAIEPPSGDMVYVEDFGWIESQGPNHVEYAEDTYENGNKIGILD